MEILSKFTKEVLAKIRASRLQKEIREREARERFRQMCRDAGGGNEEYGYQLLKNDGVFVSE